jgi:hypothetical protein
MYLFYSLIGFSAVPIIYNEYPYESSSTTIETEPYEVKYSDSYKIFVELTDYVKSYNYTDVERKMIDIYVTDYQVHVDKHGSEHIREAKRYEFRKCTEDDFNHTDFERNYWLSYKDKSF